MSKQAICDPQHYTIYERFRNIEHPLEGDENIYEIWLNWGENRDQVQFKLKLNKEYCETKDQHQHIKNKVFFTLLSYFKNHFNNYNLFKRNFAKMELKS